MEVVGKVILAMPEITGTSKAGNPWRKREYVIETQETYPKKIYFDFFGERVDQYPLEVGQNIKLYFDIESREYQGRWFTSIRGWKAEDAAAAAMAPQSGAAAMPPAPAPYGAPAPQAPAMGTVPPPPAPEQAPSDDLPF